MAYLVVPKTQAERNQVISLFHSSNLRYGWKVRATDTHFYFWLRSQQLIHTHKKCIPSLSTHMEQVKPNELYALLNRI